MAAAIGHVRERIAELQSLEGQLRALRDECGEPSIARGPFAASRALLAGLSVIEAANPDEVIRLVKDTPCAQAKGAIEIRPIMVMNDAEWRR